MATHGEKRWPPVGRFSGRLWGAFHGRRQCPIDDVPSGHWKLDVTLETGLSGNTRRPALITQAGAMSRPILERLGFEAVGRIDILLDEFGVLSTAG